MTEPIPGTEYVGFWARTLASLVDTVLSAVILSPLLSAFTGGAESIDLGSLDGAGGSPDALARLLLKSMAPTSPTDALLTWVLPAAAIIAFWVARQATPGKMLIHARIVDADTLGKPSTGRMIVRYLGYYVSLFTLGLGFFWVGWDRRKQGFHDKLANTVVIRVRPSASAARRSASIAKVSGRR